MYPPRSTPALIENAQRLCEQSEEIRDRAERVMRHSEQLHKSHLTRRKLRKQRQDEKARPRALSSS